jgi:serine/threonine-protein kinase
LKFLPAELVRDREAKARFLREAQAAAALDHPSICAVYEIEEAEGLVFIAMAYLEGSTLRKLLQAGPVALRDVVDLSIQMADGLQTAHDKGVIHRDIKPGNLMVSPVGKVKITDFGLAKFEGGSEITTDGTRMGTVSYLSPEQARGDDVDHRTDIWSLGTVMYEMIAGKRPFRGETDRAIVQAIQFEDPEPITSLSQNIPMEMQWILSKALAKRPEDRYQTAGDLVLDLKALAKGLDTETSTKLPVTTRPRPSIAVLPFVNMSGDPEDEYFSDGLTEDLITALSRIGDLRVVARTSAFSFKGKDVDVSEIGRKLHAETLLEGSVRRKGNHLRVAAQLVNAVDGYHIWSQRYDRQIEDVLAVQDEISLAIAERLQVQLLGKNELTLRRRSTKSQEAYDLHLKGRYFYHRMQIEKALSCYEQAIAADSHYGPPYAGIALTLSNLVYNGQLPPGETFRKVRTMAHQALQSDDTLAEAYVALATANLMHDYEWSEAEKQFRKGLALDPSDKSIRVWYSSLLSAMGRLDEARKQVEMSRELDPLAVGTHCFWANTFLWEMRYDEAIEYFYMALELDPRYGLARLWLGETFITAERYPAAIETLKEMEDWPGYETNVLWRLGLAYARAGEHATVHRILDRMKKDAKAKGIVPQSFPLSLIHLGLGEDDAGFEYLEKAYADRDPLMPWLRHPIWDPYRSDPRFRAVLKKMRLDD